MEATKRPWRVVEHSWCRTSIYCGDALICALSIEETATEETQEALEAEQAQHAALIVRAANTFEQAKAALKLSLEYYRAKGTQKFNHYDVEQSLEQTLAAMEDRA